MNSLLKNFPSDDGAPSLTRSFVDGLREEILAGRLAPDTRLHLQDLKDRYHISLSPIREGLAYLVAEGFVVPVGQRGYRVAPISSAALREIVDLRVNLELTGLRESILRGDEVWELLVMTSYQRLHNFENRRWGDGDAGEYEQRNKMFHRALIGACGSPLLLRFVDILSGMCDRYRRLLLQHSEPDREVLRQHTDIYSATLARNVDEACAALRGHITHAAGRVMEMLVAAEAVGAKPSKARLKARSAP